MNNFYINLLCFIIGSILCLLLMKECDNNSIQQLIQYKTTHDTIIRDKIIPGETVFIPKIKLKTIHKPIYIDNSSTFSYVDIQESSTFSDIARESSTFSAHRFIGYLADSITDKTIFPVNFLQSNLLVSPPFKSVADFKINGDILRFNLRYGLTGINIDSLYMIYQDDTLHYHEYLTNIYNFTKPWYHETWAEILRTFLTAATFSYIGNQVK